MNQSLGVLSADRLLVAVARRLQSSLRGNRRRHARQRGFTLARLGGDEFMVLLDDITDASDADSGGRASAAALRTPFDVDGHQVFTSATVGITVSTTGYERPEEVLQDAAIALHRAKAGSTTAYELFDPAMRERAMTRLQLETDLRNAIDNGELTVLYQPIISLVDRRHRGLRGAGALAPSRARPDQPGRVHSHRRRHRHDSAARQARSRGIVPADGGMAAAVRPAGAGRHVRQRVGRPVRRRTISRPKSRQILDETGLEPSKLKLEITESAFIGDVGRAEATLARLQSMGVEWSIDDFGTGYSSLSYLHRLQANTVKVDRSFVSRMGVDAKGSEMVRAIVALALNLGMDVVAEGVETLEQMVALQTLGCAHAQGFYFSRPVDLLAADGLIASQPWREEATDHALLDPGFRVAPTTVVHSRTYQRFTTPFTT